MSWSAAQLYTVVVYAPVPGDESWLGAVTDAAGHEVVSTREPSADQLMAVLGRELLERVEREATTA